MQMTQLFRRGVVVPLNDDAENALYNGEVDETTQVHFVEIDSEADFITLWQTGVFKKINETTGSMLDDYEEDIISIEMIPRVRQLANFFAKNQIGATTGAWFFPALVEACDIAERLDKPIFFIL